MTKVTNWENDPARVAPRWHCCWPECDGEPVEPPHYPICRSHVLETFAYCQSLTANASPEQLRMAIPAQTQPARSVIYYLRLRDLVKIGTTRQIVHRVKAIPNEGLLAVEFGDLYVERDRHRQFDHLRRVGEWFELDVEIETHIAAVRAKFEAELGISTQQWFAAQA